MLLDVRLKGWNIRSIHLNYLLFNSFVWCSSSTNIEFIGEFNNNVPQAIQIFVSFCFVESKPVFTKVPPSPSYVVEGNGLFLQWSYILNGTFRQAKFHRILPSSPKCVIEGGTKGTVVAIFRDCQSQVKAKITTNQTKFTFLSLTWVDAGNYALQVTEAPDEKNISSTVIITLQCK